MVSVLSIKYAYIADNRPELESIRKLRGARAGVIVAVASVAVNILENHPLNPDDQITKLIHQDIFDLLTTWRLIDSIEMLLHQHSAGSSIGFDQAKNLFLSSEIAGEYGRRIEKIIQNRQMGIAQCDDEPFSMLTTENNDQQNRSSKQNIIRNLFNIEPRRPPLASIINHSNNIILEDTTHVDRIMERRMSCCGLRMWR